MRAFQFSMYSLVLLIPAFVGIGFGYGWGICVKPAIDSGLFTRQKTYREVQLERDRIKEEQRKNANIIP